MGMEEGRASRGPRGLSGQPLRRAMTPLDPSLLWMLAPITAPSTMLSVVQAPNSQAPPLSPMQSVRPEFEVLEQ